MRSTDSLCRTLVLEWRQWRVTGVGAAITSTWNLLDVGSLLLFLPITGLTLAVTPLNPSVDSAGQCYAALLVMCAVNSVLLWGRMLHYLRAFQATGPLVRMIMEIVKDIKVCGCVGVCVVRPTVITGLSHAVCYGAHTSTRWLLQFQGKVQKVLLTHFCRTCCNVVANTVCICCRTKSTKHHANMTSKDTVPLCKDMAPINNNHACVEWP
jgi:hypothetical protein